MVVPPCGNCENKGCGSYHDECEKFQKYKKMINDARDYRRRHSMLNSLTINPKNKDRFDRLK